MKITDRQAVADGSIWPEIQEKGDELPVQWFDEAFKKKGGAAKKAKTPGGKATPSGAASGAGSDAASVSSRSSAAKVEKVTLFSQQRQQNAKIALHRLKLTPIQARDRLLQCQGISDEQLELLGPLLGTQEEQEQVTEWLGQGGPEHHPTRLGEVERFVVETMSVPQAHKRVQLMQLARRLSADLPPASLPEPPGGDADPVLAPLREQIDTLAAAARAIRLSKSLPAVLRVVLFAGNRMNAGTSRGQARGFKLGALEKLRSTKTTGGLDGAKVSVLDVIARASASPATGMLPEGSKPPPAQGAQEQAILVSPGGELLQATGCIALPEDLEVVVEASRIHLDDLEAVMQQLEGDVRGVAGAVRKASAGGSEGAGEEDAGRSGAGDGPARPADRLKTAGMPFIEAAEKALAGLKGSLDEALKALKALSSRFADKTLERDPLAAVRMLASFGQELASAREREMKKRKKAAEAAAAASGGKSGTAAKSSKGDATAAKARKRAKALRAGKKKRQDRAKRLAASGTLRQKLTLHAQSVADEDVFGAQVAMHGAGGDGDDGSLESPVLGASPGVAAAGSARKAVGGRRGSDPSGSATPPAPQLGSPPAPRPRGRGKVAANGRGMGMAEELRRGVDAARRQLTIRLQKGELQAAARAGSGNGSSPPTPGGRKPTPPRSRRTVRGKLFGGTIKRGLGGGANLQRGLAAEAAAVLKSRLGDPNK